MKAVTVTGHGGLEQLAYIDQETPQPKQGEVLIEIKACALNNTEIWMREGAYGAESESGWKAEGVQFPRIPGSDISGRIVAVGDGVAETEIGRDVVLFPFTASGEIADEQSAEDLSFIGSEYDGGYAEYVCWPLELCYDMPLASYTDSAVFSVSGLTAWHMVEQLDLQQGQTVLVTGASGGVGSLNVQIAKRVFGARVVALVGDLKLTDQLQELGADLVVSYREPDWDQQVMQEVGSVDAILDVVGDAVFKHGLDLLKRGGTYCISGSSGGQVTSLDFRTLYLKHIRLQGSVLGNRHDYEKLLEAVRTQTIQPVIDRTFPLAEAREAQAYFKQAGKFGKVVLLP
ncbi:zinc-binding dehydrogenase [Exiguobacterium indicum]|uniref:zinc-binding dehydrogenase n=1 Tax=Exiguobacterium indicum TaxID=296995 RepID=UPI002B25D778|nr:zinc-binding dehydrogenase [Exiguobacterium indicum]